jgi:hypothetical protein
MEERSTMASEFKATLKDHNGSSNPRRFLLQFNNMNRIIGKQFFFGNRDTGFEVVGTDKQYDSGITQKEKTRISQ